MHILLTGGTGFIGKALCEELVRRGHSLTVVTRRASQINVSCLTAFILSHL